MMKVCADIITDTDVDFYNENGYWISPKLLTDEQIAILRKEHERIWDKERDFDVYPWDGPRIYQEQNLNLKKFDNGWWINKAIRKLIFTPEIGYIASRLMDTSEVRLWHDQVLWKEGQGQDARETGNVGWHQDYSYWQCSSTTNMVTAWIALQDTDFSNGCMKVVVGSHKWGFVKDSNTFFDQDLEKLKKQYANGRKWIEQPIILKAGQASFHHALCFHGSGPNSSTEPRLSITMHMMPKDCAYRAGIQYHGNIRGLGPFAKNGDLFAGNWFPKLWPIQ